MGEPGIRVLCVDDHRLVRDGLALIINREPDLEVVGLATSGEEAVRRFHALEPDVTLMDLQLPGMSGMEAIRSIREYRPNARIIVLTMLDGEEDVYRALHAGAATYLFKDMMSDDLVRVIREVHTGHRPLLADIHARLDERSAHPSLSDREVQVLELARDGLRNKEIGATLCISTETVRVHMKNILLKLAVNDRGAAVNLALRRGIIHLR